MRNMLRRFIFFGVLSVALVSACFLGNRKPNLGDTVSPKLADPIHWRAGQNGEISVRLQAQANEHSSIRELDFSGVPADVNPVATITFFQGSTALSPIEVPLDHRCWGGLYKTSVEVPSSATKARIVLSFPWETSEFKFEKADMMVEIAN